MQQSDNTLFFSYGHDNYQPLVEKIKSFLEEEGFIVFLDVDKLHAGEDWEIRLENAISGYEKFLFFITRHAIRRPDGYCLNEITEAFSLKKEIIPIAFENEKLPLSINRLQYLDFKNLVLAPSHIEFEEKMQQLLAVLKGDKYLDKEGQQGMIQSMLDPIDFTAYFIRHKHIIGREWIIKKVTDWQEKYQNSRILWITAEAGYGKSALAVFLSNQHPDVIGVHFCSFNAHERNSPINVVKNLAFHFQSQIDGYADEIKDVDIEAKGIGELVETLILNPLERVCDAKKLYLFIIDGVDEAKHNNKNGVAELIRDHLSLLPPNIKIIVTSRPEAYLKQTFSQFNTLELLASEQENDADCRAFIAHSIKAYGIEDANIYIESLLEQSRSNILYLSKFFEAVQVGLIDKTDIRAFPQGLNGLYGEFFDRIFTDLDKYADEYSPIFELIIRFGETISKELLVSILGLTTIKLKRRLNTMGPFIKEVDGLLQISHQSVKEWLQQEENTKYEVDLEDADNRLISYFTAMTQELFLRYSHITSFHAFCIIYTCEKDPELTTYRLLLESIVDAEEKVVKCLGVMQYFLDNKQDKLFLIIYKLLLELLETNSQNKIKIDILIPYYLKVLNYSIVYAYETKTYNNVKECIKQIEGLFSRNPQLKETQYVDEFSSLLLDWSIYLTEHNTSEASGYLKKSTKYHKKSSSSSESYSEYDIKSLTTATTLLSIPIFESVGKVGAVAGGIGAAAFLGPIGIIGGMVAANLFGNESKKKKNQKGTNNNAHIKFKKTMKMYERNLEVIEQSMQVNKQKWIKDYVTLVIQLIPLYTQVKQSHKGKALLQKSLGLLEELVTKNPNRWEGLHRQLIVLKKS